MRNLNKMKQKIILLIIGVLISLHFHGQSGASDKIDRFFKTEIKEVSTEFGDLVYSELKKIEIPDSNTLQLSDKLEFYYAEIRADQFGMPIALTVPTLLHGEEIAVYLPGDNDQKKKFIELLGLHQNPHLDKETISKNLFNFIRPVLMESRTIETQNADIVETNIQVLNENNAIHLTEIGSFIENGVNKGDHVTMEITFLFRDKEIIGIQ
jgi:hypothetical protein